MNLYGSRFPLHQIQAVDANKVLGDWVFVVPAFLKQKQQARFTRLARATRGSLHRGTRSRHGTACRQPLFQGFLINADLTSETDER